MTRKTKRGTAWWPVVLAFMLGLAAGCLIWAAVAVGGSAAVAPVSVGLDKPMGVLTLAELVTPEDTEDPEEDAKNTAALLAQGYYRDDIPLSYELQDVTQTVCAEFSVPYALALGVMEQESGFDPEVVSSTGCYGLMQLNPDYFPADLAPSENIRAGVGYLGELLGKHEGVEAAVTAYFYGPSGRTSSWYSDAVLDRAERWEELL